MSLFRKRLTVTCPHCGGFWEGLDALRYTTLMALHPNTVVLGFDGDYRQLVDEVIEQAEAVVA